ncbi:hypothetical protein Vlu01_27750 [Micromonospora lutea]|uniref:Uncharacterized protein n=1 Tax=Micromonospora lutea TaxID=419825 RepID=A0ABQ4IW47_9ACTN|nr:hypothetical protein Vlu01_27750 [Micromonospora lutea]
MGASAFLFCSCNRICWGLGKPLSEQPGGTVIRYAGDPGQPVFSQSRLHSSALWKLLADHVGHQLRVAHDWDPELHGQMESGVLPAMLDADGELDVPLPAYLAGWPEDGFANLLSAGFDGTDEGFLTCERCPERLALGRVLRDRAGAPLLFHAGDPGEVANSRQPELNAAAWRFLTVHFQHPLRVVAYPPGERAPADGCVTVGGGRSGGMSLAAYVRGFTG